MLTDSEIKAEPVTLSGKKWAATKMNSLQDCCLIVPTYQRPSEVEALLSALLSYAESERPCVPGEVIVVDGSVDDCVEKVIAMQVLNCLPFDLLYIRSSPGLTRQRNVGIDVSTRELVFFLDDDAIPYKDYFSFIRRAFLDDPDKAIGAIGGCVVNEWNCPLNWRWRARLALGIIPRVEPMRYLHCGTSNPRAQLRPYSGIRQVDILSGCAMTFRREVLVVERFSEFFDGYCQGEDMEMALRVGRTWKVMCSGDAKVIHNQAPSGRPPSFSKGRMEVRNRLFIWCRHSAQNATIIDKVRLSLDLAFTMAIDLVSFLAKPWTLASLRHFFGMAYALCESVFDDPRKETLNPPAQYEIRLTHV